MCIRDRIFIYARSNLQLFSTICAELEQLDLSVHDARIYNACLLYTSDAADERSSVDLGGRRIIKKKKTDEHRGSKHTYSNI